MFDLLLELKAYIKEHYTGKEKFEQVYDLTSPKADDCVELGDVVCEECLELADEVCVKEHQEFADEVCVKERPLPKPMASKPVEMAKQVCYNFHPACYGKALQEKSSLDDLLRKTEPTFSDKLNEIICTKELTDVEVYKRANLDRRLFSKLRNRDYKPGKSTILALIIALELNMQEARELLSYAGYNLAPNEKTDIIISFCLEKKIYDIFSVNEILDSYGEKCLGNSIK